MSTVLLLGFLLGMRHSLEADHIAAVASLITRTKSMKNAVRLGAAWGVGHTLMLFVFGAAALLLHSTISQTLAMWLELLVGAMLIMLGLDVVYRLIRDRIHYHIHEHDREVRHFHAHSHKNEKRQKPHPRHHEHEHHGALPKRALFVGMMHGMAGSAVLIVMTLQSIKSIWTGLFYIALFGIGSIIGMAALTMIIAIPLQKTSFLTRFHNILQALIGAMTIILGLSIIHTSHAAIISVSG